MAQFNACAQLVTDEATQQARNAAEGIRSNGEQYLDIMMQMQRSLQVKLAKEKPEMNLNPNEIETAGQAVDWMRTQWDSMSDEFRELLTSFGGMSNGESAATSVWKAWRAKNLDMRNTKLEDLSADDRREIFFEIIDLWHFFLNMNIALGLTSEDIFEGYFIKNAENFARQDRGY
ncbi:dUTPase [Acinetobacter phage ZZ1]|uniref:dCTPase n=3 Tax=Caudoviricetes TaxID=2731619 RepID=A0A410T5J0_9CAUD|nr:dUTPase [Acinetobacter phage ZZ1]AFL47572.1 dCTPase [Acinetobacter phage ZZ1]QAU03914.1 dCTPase [Acinetobacter phage Henu6]